MTSFMLGGASGMGRVIGGSGSVDDPTSDGGAGGGCGGGATCSKE